MASEQCESHVVAATAVADETPTAAGDDAVASVRAAWQAEFPDRDFDFHVDHQRHLRSQFDFLDDSNEAIAAVMAAPNINGAFERYSIQMTDAELAEMDRRARVQREFPAIAAAAVGADWSEELVEGLDPDGTFGAFAGRWIDQ